MGRRAHRELRAGHIAPAAFTALAMAVGCNAVIDIGDIEFDDAPPGTTTSATSTSSSGQGGSGAGTTSSSTTTSSSGGGSGGFGGSGGSGGSVGPPAEICSNGIDDNNDGLADCEDPLCGHAICSDLTVPAQWEGPFIFYEGADPNVTCPSAWPTTEATGYNGTVDAPPATCGACSCGAVQGATCPATAVTFYTSGNCGLGNQGSQTPGTNCTIIGDRLNLLDSAIAPNTVAAGGNCTPAGGAATVVPATTSLSQLLCAQPQIGVGCPDAGDSCVERGQSPFRESLCITRNGNQSCPAGAYSVRLDLNTSLTDTRDCSNCNCGSANGVSCTAGMTEIFTGEANTGCSGAAAETVMHNNTCYAFDNAGSMKYTPGTASGGQCAASGGAPIGSAIIGNRISVCCTP